MVTVDKVCGWCGRELLKGNIPGDKVAPGCLSLKASHGCCDECRGGPEAEVKEYLKEIRNGQNVG